jgi:hypothetical protein
MPEGFTAPAETIAAYGNILGKYNLSQEAGQELIDFHANAMKNASEAWQRQQQDSFNDLRKQWVSELGKEFGNRRDTVIDNAKWVVAQYGGTKEQRRELLDALTFTGMGDHRAMARLLNNVSKQLREREAPPAVQGKSPEQHMNPAERRYRPRAS